MIYSVPSGIRAELPLYIIPNVDPHSRGLRHVPRIRLIKTIFRELTQIMGKVDNNEGAIAVHKAFLLIALV